jgi:hypothetical protein
MEEKCQLGNFKENQHIEVGYLIQENITISIDVNGNAELLLEKIPFHMSLCNSHSKKRTFFLLKNNK